MPFMIPIIWSWISSGWVGFIMPLVSKIPWQVWAALAAIIAVLYYGSVREKRGFNKCHVQVVAATEKENTRRLEAANGALQEAQQQASDTARRARTLEDENAKLQSDVDKLASAKTVCVPKSVTDRLNRPGRVRNIR